MARISVKKTLSALLGLSVLSAVGGTLSIHAFAADPEPQILETSYADLWSGTISVKAGAPVKWVVSVPEDTELKGCGATVKVSDPAWEKAYEDREEQYLKLTQGENTVYEFTPAAETDILFTCWMGANCHHNYIHVTADGAYSVSKPEDPTDISAERAGSEVTVRFSPSQTPEGAEITGYKVTATDENGKRKKAVVTESPAVLTDLDASLAYTIKVVALATSGDSAGENELTLAAEPETTSPLTGTETVSENQTTVQETTAASAAESASASAAASETKTTESTTAAAKTTSASPAKTTAAAAPKAGDSGAHTAAALFGGSLLLLAALRFTKKH